MPTCKVPGCISLANKAKGLCGRHYMHRWWHYKAHKVMMSLEDLAKAKIRVCEKHKGTSRKGIVGKDYNSLPHPEGEALNPALPPEKANDVIAVKKKLTPDKLNLMVLEAKKATLDKEIASFKDQIAMKLNQIRTLVEEVEALLG
jgi:hypothetical protein